MCGICGLVGSENKQLVHKMTKIMQHRGPDDDGVYFDKNIGLGHRRLSIIDLGGGHQPMHNESESIWVVFNGEIYNYLQLKKELEKNGHRFKSNSDTEVIVHAYEEYGEDCPRKLRGMFAFAIWDSDNKKLFLARDRLGIKPLYYSKIGDQLIFASEIKAILLHPEIKRKVNICALHKYLVYRYVPSPDTMFRGIMKLPQGYSLSFSQCKVKLSRYWDLKLKSLKTKSEQYYVKKLNQLLESCVKMRLMSDVPLGAFLSGGLDSSSLVAVMSKLSDQPVKTFSVGFEAEDRFNELEHAQVVADHFGTNHHQIIVKADAVELLPKLIWHLDEPLADSATIPTFLISEFARKKVTVVLAGEGADENFAGYNRYQIMLRYYSLPKFQEFLKLGLRYLSRVVLNKRLSNYFQYLSLLNDPAHKYLTGRKVFSGREIKKHARFELEVEPSSIIQPFFSMKTNLLKKMLFADIKTWLPDDLLMKIDKMSMASSLEARVPFIDHKLVQFSLSIPSSLKIVNGTEKYILKKTMSKILPKSIIKRKKHGFNVPIDSWFMDGLGEIEENILDSTYINPRYIHKLLKLHKSGKKDYGQRLWTILTFQLWHKMFIESDQFNPHKYKGVFF